MVRGLVTVNLPDAEGDALLAEIEAALRRYVYFPEDDAYCAMALWTLHTYCFDVWKFTPYVHATSRNRGEGKSTFLDVEEAFCFRAVGSASMSTAVAYRMVDKLHPTLLCDEMDGVFGTSGSPENDDLRRLLNAGFQRGKPVWRCENFGQTFRRFDPFCPKILAGIRGLPDTLTSRSIRIELRKVSPGLVEPLDGDALSELQDAGKAWAVRAEAWVAQHREALVACKPVTGLANRERDTWLPLFALAEVVGGEWPARIASAERYLAAVQTEVEQQFEVKVDILLLQDLARVFYVKKWPEFLPTDEIVRLLNLMSERPWPTWNRGDRFNANNLASELAPYQVKSSRPMHQGVKQRGYAWAGRLEEAVHLYVNRDVLQAMLDEMVS